MDRILANFGREENRRGLENVAFRPVFRGFSPFPATAKRGEKIFEKNCENAVSIG
jgi:hypothetical protein